MFYITHILFFLCTFAAEFTNSIVQNMMKSMKLFVAIVATVLSFSSCSKDNDDQVIQDNPLKNTGRKCEHDHPLGIAEIRFRHRSSQ